MDGSTREGNVGGNQEKKSEREVRKEKETEEASEAARGVRLTQSIFG